MYKRQGVDPDIRCKDLSDEDVAKLREVIINVLIHVIPVTGYASDVDKRQA